MTDEYYKIPQPALLTDMYLRDKIRDQVPKPTAMGTQARYSDAGGCARAIGYSALGVRPTNPMDAPGVWVTGLGTVIHELIQQAIHQRIPEFQSEVPTQVGQYISGSCDGVLLARDVEGWQHGNTVYELKTMGAFAYDKQIGLKRRARKLDDAEGPKFQAILQAGLNALGWDEAHPDPRDQIDTLLLGSVSMEAVSIQLASDAGLNDIQRIMVEFVIPHAVWWSAATQEAQRISNIVEQVNDDVLPPRFVLTDIHGSYDAISPDAARPAWQCTYCKYQDRCAADGNATQVPVDIQRRK